MGKMISTGKRGRMLDIQRSMYKEVKSNVNYAGNMSDDNVDKCFVLPNLQIIFHMVVNLLCMCRSVESVTCIKNYASDFSGYDFIFI